MCRAGGNYVPRRRFVWCVCAPQQVCTYGPPYHGQLSAGISLAVKEHDIHGEGSAEVVSWCQAADDSTRIFNQIYCGCDLCYFVHLSLRYVSHNQDSDSPVGS